MFLSIKQEIHDSWFLKDLDGLTQTEDLHLHLPCVLSACQICNFVTCEVTETKNRNQGQSCDVKPNTISLFLSVLSENAWLKTAASIDNTHAFPCDIVDEQTTRVSVEVLAAVTHCTWQKKGEVASEDLNLMEVT